MTMLAVYISLMILFLDTPYKRMEADKARNDKSTEAASQLPRSANSALTNLSTISGDNDNDTASSEDQVKVEPDENNSKVDSSTKSTITGESKISDVNTNISQVTNL